MMTKIRRMMTKMVRMMYNIFRMMTLMPTEGAPEDTACRAYSIWTSFPLRETPS